MQKILANRAFAPIGRAERQADETYRYYRIVAGQKGDAFAAVAYASTSQAFLAAGDSLESAVDSLKQMIDDDFVRRSRNRHDDKPCAEDFERALELGRARRTAIQQYLVERMWQIGDKPVSLELIQTRSEYSSDAIGRALIRLARQMADILEIPLATGPNGGAAAMALLFEADEQDFAFDAEWMLNGEFYRALNSHMGARPRTSSWQ